MLLSVIIINWNTCKLLVKCLNAIYTYPPSCSFEIIVVDNASTDESLKTVKQQFPDVILITNQENVGFARANNQAIQTSSSDYFLLLNSDAFVGLNSLQSLVAVMDSNPNAAICGPMLLNKDKTFQASFADFPTLKTELIHQLGLAKLLISSDYPSHSLSQSLIQQKVDWVGGACMIVRRNAIEQAGLLDESFIMYGEEMEWCYRIKQCGWEIIFCPDAKVVHLGGQSSTAMPDWKYIQIQKGTILFFAKHYGLLLARILAFITKSANFAKSTVFFFYKQVYKNAEPHFHTYWKAARAKLL
ncbi:MAG: glycosyltransferase family 2 protein [Anaerolineales bacterium]|nr:glycosyltransferase family 2 protein [Anaerolineales bacterium]